MPRILVVDDERQIHASLRLRLAQDYDLCFCLNAKEALETISANRFDLCFVDIHMPKMDGIVFIDAARKVDPDLGYVIITAFDTDENLRRSIPLQVYDFLSKPLPERAGFEGKIPDWIERTQQRRQESELAKRAESVASDLDAVVVEREIEVLASENTRAALRQITTLLTTIHAHLVAAGTLFGTKPRTEHQFAQLQRNMNEARQGAEAAIAVSESFFESSYGNRESSMVIANDGIRDAINIALRVGHAEEANKAIDFKSLDARISLQGTTGINFLLMLVPILTTALHLTAANTTIRVHAEHYVRLDLLVRDSRLRSFFWFNRKNVSGSSPCLAISVSMYGPSLSRTQIESWLKGEYAPLSSIASRGMVAAVVQSKGLLGFSSPPTSAQLSMILALPA